MGDCSTPLRAGIIGAWARRAGDPAAGIERWLVHGAPAGIEKDIDDFGVFPDKDTNETITLQELNTMHVARTNYQSLESYPQAERVIQELLDANKDWIHVSL